MKPLLCAVLAVLFFAPALWAAPRWEKQGEFYYLTKTTRDNFSAAGAGTNKFTDKYLSRDGIDFLVRGTGAWQDYGRLDLEGNKMFSLPIPQGVKVDELHLLAGGNFGNSYEHDKYLRLYGDNYFYSVVTVIFSFQDGAYAPLSVPVFWDWFHLPPGEWSKDGALIKSIGSNPVRKDCAIFHIKFANPRPAQPLKDILITDSWLSDRPYSDIFALTIKSPDALEALPRENQRFKAVARDAAKETADTAAEWAFDTGLDGWVAAGSANWDSEADWQKERYGRQGVVSIPGCNWAGDKYGWIEKKVKLPDWGAISLQFFRHSAQYSEQDKAWSDGLLKVIVKGASAPETVYEKLYSGEWSAETADLSKYKGQAVLIRFENHGAGSVRLGPSSSPACDAEDALIDDIRLRPGK